MSTADRIKRVSTGVHVVFQLQKYDLYYKKGNFHLLLRKSGSLQFNQGWGFVSILYRVSKKV